MLITPRGLQYLVYRDKRDYRLILKMAKMLGMRIPGRLDKSMDNAASGKHRPSRTTSIHLVSFINAVLEKAGSKNRLSLGDVFGQPMDGVSSGLSPHSVMREQYLEFFEFAGGANSFFSHEVFVVLRFLEKIDAAFPAAQGLTEETFNAFIQGDALISQIDLSHDILVKLPEEIGCTFSLNLTLYLLMALGVSISDADFSYRGMFERFFLDAKEGKLDSTFNYYISAKQEIGNLSLERVSESIGLSNRHLLRVKSARKERVSDKTLEHIIDNGDWWLWVYIRSLSLLARCLVEVGYERNEAGQKIDQLHSLLQERFNRWQNDQM